jgi:hypothetical protein
MLVQCGGGRTGSASSRQSYLERAVYDASQGCGWQPGARRKRRYGKADQRRMRGWDDEEKLQRLRE